MLINDCVKFSHRLEVIMFGRKIYSMRILGKRSEVRKKTSGKTAACM